MKLLCTLLVLLAGVATAPARAQDTLLNVSYDPTRELYRAMNRSFAASWLQQTNRRITVNVSHGGSGAQARSVLEGLLADVVTLAAASDVDALAGRGLLASDWQTRLPDHSSPMTSTIVFLVRAGNPKEIHDWPDLVRPGVAVITPNPKTSGGARWNYLAAYGWAVRQPGGTDATAEEYLRQLFAQVPVLDTGARGATTNFVQRGQGDVLLAWENEALLARGEAGVRKVEIVYPSISILAEPPVAVVDSVVDRRGSRVAAEAYLNFLYTPEGQEIAARNFYRPRDQAVTARHAELFPAIAMFDIDAFGGWRRAQAVHFAEGGVFDRITARR